ncbi:MAG: helix-turn-helix transcriptional regulator [Steroidobacteraceae bacterium]
MEASLPDRIRMAQLARLVGLSTSHFSRAFKASAGIAPYQWQWKP